MRRIKLTQNKFALVDDCDYEYLSQWNWCYDPKGYAMRGSGTRANQHMVYMHRVVAKRAGLRITRKQVDHRDEDGINNQRNNLRVATTSQNMSNRGPQKNNTSGHKGVWWDKSRSKWCAEITVKQKKHYLGRFINKQDAARAYKLAAEKYFGEFAKQ